MQELALRRYRLSVSAFFLILGMIFGTWASCIPAIKEKFGLSDSELGGILFSIPAGQLIAMGFSAWAIKRFGSRKALLTGSFIIPFLLLAAGLSAHIAVLIISLLLFGMCDNLFNISANTQGVNAENLYKRTIMSSFHGLFSLGGFVGALFGLVCGLLSIDMILQLLSILTLSLFVTLVCGRNLVKNDYIPQKETVGSDYKDIKTSRQIRIDGYVILLGIIALCAMICEGVMYDWSGVFFKDVVKVKPSFVQMGYAICMGCMTLGRFCADKYVERYGARMVVRVSGIMIFVGLIASSMVPNLEIASIAFAVVGFGISASVPICYSLAGKNRTYNPSTALTIVTTIGFFGFLSGPPLIGFLASTITLRWTFSVMALMGLAVAIMAGIIHRKDTEIK